MKPSEHGLKELRSIERFEFPLRGWNPTTRALEREGYIETFQKKKTITVHLARLTAKGKKALADMKGSNE